MQAVPPAAKAAPAPQPARGCITYGHDVWGTTSGLCRFWCKVGIGAAILGIAACIIAEPCGAIEGTTAVTVGGAAVLTDVSISVAPGVIASTLAGGAIGGVIANSTSGSGSGSGGGGSSGPVDRTRG